jgi:hypothetical protein
MLVFTAGDDEKIIRNDISQYRDVMIPGSDRSSTLLPELKFGILFMYSIIWFMKQKRPKFSLIFLIYAQYKE